ncbi:MAG: hypothetical protein IJR90_01625 [Clostridia bacterium]|nr:hypothetical protein [Clostridia bacterium]
MNKVKKSFSLILAVCFILSCVCFPAAVAADSPVTLNGTGYGDLESAFADAQTGDMIVVKSDVTVGSTIKVTRNLILLSNGAHTVSASAALIGPVFEIDAGGTLTVSSNTVFTCGSDRTFAAVNGGTFNVRGEVSFRNCGTAIDIMSGVCAISGGSFSGNRCAVNVSDKASGLRLSGSVSFAKNDLITLPVGGRIYVVGELTGSGYFPVSLESCEKGDVIAEASYADVSITDRQASRFTVRYPGGTANVETDGKTVRVAEKTESGDPDDPVKEPVARIGARNYASLDEAFAAASGTVPETVVLISDVTVDKTIKIGGKKQVSLISEGKHTIKRAENYLSGTLIEVSRDAALNIGVGGDGLVISGGGADAVMPAVRVDGKAVFGSHLTVTDCVNNNSSLMYQGTVFVTSGGSLTVDGATVSGNVASAGGAIMIYGGSVEILNGANIRFNKAKNGGGVYLYSGSLTMTAGTINDNTAEENGGAVYCSGAFELANAIIPGTGRKGENDVFLSKGRSISVRPVSGIVPGTVTLTPGEPDDGAALAVYADGKLPETGRFELSDAVNEAFELLPDGNKLILKPLAAKVAYIGSAAFASLKEAVEAVPDDGSETLITVVCDVPFTETVAIPAGKSVALTVGRDAKDTADYAARTFTRGEEFSGSFFEIAEGAKLTLSGAEGKKLIVDGSAFPALSSLVSVYGEFEMKADSVLSGNQLTLDEKTADPAPVLYTGGAVTVHAKGRFTMSGGVIEKNYAAFGGGVYIIDGVFVFTEGEIKDNKALFGGGAYIYNTLTLDNVTETEDPPAQTPENAEEVRVGYMEMTGGVISGNSCMLAVELPYPAGQGGGVYIGNAATLSLGGGSIEKNTAVLGSGIYEGTERSVDEPAVRVPVFELYGTASITDNDLYLTLPDESRVTVRGVPNGLSEKTPLVITMPDLLAVNSGLVRYEIEGFTPEQNEHAAKSAIGAGWYKLGGDAAEYYKPDVSTGDGSLIINSTGENEYLRYAPGREYNGLPEYGKSADGAGTASLEYGPIEIYPGGCFTVSFEDAYYFNLYPNVRAQITGAFPRGTVITLISFSDPAHPAYYSYEVNGTEEVKEAAQPDASGLKAPDVIAVPLHLFTLMKDGKTKFGDYAEGEKPSSDPKALLREKITLTVDFSAVLPDEKIRYEGEFTMSVGHIYPGKTEGSELDFSRNFKKVEYTVGIKNESQVMVTSDQSGVTVSYVLDANSRTAAAGCGLILIELARGSFPNGTVASIGGRVYPAAPGSGSIVVPVPLTNTGLLSREGTVRIDIYNYYGSAVVDATLRAVIYPSVDGLHIRTGEKFDAASEGIAYTLSSQDKWALSVTDESGEKPTFVFKRGDVPDLLTMIVRAERNGEPAATVRVTLEDSDYDYKAIPLSTVFAGFDDSDGNGADIMISDPVKLRPKKGSPNGEYRLAIKAGDKTEYVKIVIY